MSNIVAFPDGCRFDEGATKRVAQEIIDALGPSAGFAVGKLARAGSLSPVGRARLMAVADEIAACQGYSWYFPEDEAEEEAS